MPKRIEWVFSGPTTASGIHEKLGLQKFNHYLPRSVIQHWEDTAVQIKQPPALVRMAYSFTAPQEVSMSRNAFVVIPLGSILALTACGGGEDSSTATQFGITAQINGLSESGLELSVQPHVFRATAGSTQMNLGSWPSGTLYEVRVQTQPANMQCAVTNASGTLKADTSVSVQCSAIGAADLSHLLVGTSQNILKANGSPRANPAVGSLWLCAVPANGAGATPSNDWKNNDGTWDYVRKPQVTGGVPWTSVFSVNVSKGQRIIAGNGLPNHPSGIFPITRATSPSAFPYDGNPSHITSQNVQLTFSQFPTVAPSPRCVPYGATGILLTGSAVYHGASTLGTDAAAYEMLDDYGGHSDGTGTYHYHFLSPKLQEKLDPVSTGHSALTGYMMDGFGLYGPRGEDGRIMTNAQLDSCHGHTHNVNWDGQHIAMYHYHWTYDFPYNIGCFKGVPVVPWNG